MRKMFLVLLLVAVPAFVWADEYVLVMSKEDNMCQHMLKIYNADLKKYGEIKYDEHEEFTAIKWEEKKYLSKSGVNDTRITYISKFDVNNDGKEEIIVNMPVQWKSGLSDSLFIFKGDTYNMVSSFFEEEKLFNENNLKKIIGAIGPGGIAPFDGNTYHLKELPPSYSLKNLKGDEEYKHYYTLTVPFYIKPLLYKGKYYLTIREDTSAPIKQKWQVDTIKEWLVTFQYTTENQIKDTCYYLKVSEYKSKNK